MTRVRFTADSRHGDWTKGTLGAIVKELALPPDNQFALYVIELESGVKVWATNKDIEPHNQMTIYDEM